jgi:NAD(P)-dependent dehydrogenase (short-subunit alcohol dehydrogenase family)
MPQAEPGPIRLTLTLPGEFGLHPVRVNAIVPGAVDTDM